jgi:glutathione peroxidase-family protein
MRRAYVTKVSDDVDLALVRLHEFFGCVDESGFDKHFDRSIFSCATIVNLAHSSKCSFTQDFEQLEFIPEPSAYFDLGWQEKDVSCVHFPSENVSL